jgi:S-adenosylmethionine:tRNA ribosyltransferase-isomerase
VNTADFDYDLPPGRIAQRPAPRREDARMLVLRRAGGAPEHRRVADLPEFLRAGDLLVVNDTRVIPCRLEARKPTGGRVELFLLEERAPGLWDALLHASRRPRPGTPLAIGSGRARATVVEEGERGRALVRVESDVPFAEVLAAEGRTPLPPYIARAGADAAQESADRERYQTVYARAPGAVAAPTAGLHFSEALLARLASAGVGRAAVTLHVGLGTFRPVTSERAEDHVLEAERYEVAAAAAEAVAAARRAGGRVVAVGTTTVRTLETAAAGDGEVRASSGRSALFIRPPYRFRAVDALLTNFHLPRSTLLMLVCAFAGRERVLAAYAEAVREGYRFYSYGDAMLIL